MTKRSPKPLHGRGAVSNPDDRFAAHGREWADDGWGSLEVLPERLATTLGVDSSRRVISYNDSPDVGCDRSVNPYRGCEHGCVYCFARPSHAYLGLSPGLDFETRLFHKPDAPNQLRVELGQSGYRPAPLMLGINTDAYQPVERRLGLTRKLLAILAETRHPTLIVTKSALVERDLDLLAPMAADGLLQVVFSITSLDATLARRLEPRAASPARRLEALGRLAAAGVPCGVFVAPLIPVLTDAELEAILAAGRDAGARFAGYVLLRLPHETEALFTEWLAHHAPLKAAHVMSRLRACRGGEAYDSRFGQRMTGSGDYAQLLARRFAIAVRKLGFEPPLPLRSDRFRPPRDASQLDLFP